ncbi:hypothetical protein EDD18DRAFT_1353254 [Armillaria luteobubalina]|uniref:Tetrapyrrole biosynthesis uroporphyrinogen III synthase domain-containing protein n=1 Tax=Armillaria luteobubalina TaxID=153913 RepID=A0AA39Q5N9_9AGAR|nr:hypothetical protein EDD18DRAFT_1353254 [Armillaria luteobubalina]
MMTKANVLLLREPAPSPDTGKDRYEVAFTRGNYTPFSIPVLETVLTNITELASVAEQQTVQKMTDFYSMSLERLPPRRYVPAWSMPTSVENIRERRSTHFILAEQSRPTKLLYLTGDKNRDTLPNILGSAGQLKKIVPVRSIMPWWMVFFAPSAAEFVLPFLKEQIDLGSVKVAVIGPITATFLRETLKLRVDAIHTKLSPEDLLRAVVDVDATC